MSCTIVHYITFILFTKIILSYIYHRLMSAAFFSYVKWRSLVAIFGNCISKRTVPMYQAKGKIEGSIFLSYFTISYNIIL